MFITPTLTPQKRGIRRRNHCDMGACALVHSSMGLNVSGIWPVEHMEGSVFCWSNSIACFHVLRTKLHIHAYTLSDTRIICNAYKAWITAVLTYHLRYITENFKAFIFSRTTPAIIKVPTISHFSWQYSTWDIFFWVRELHLILKRTKTLGDNYSTQLLEKSPKAPHASMQNTIAS